MELVSTFSERLSVAMKLRHTGTTELAEKLQISKQSVSAYVNGKRKPKRLLLLEIARVLDVDSMWLMGYDTDIKRANDGPSVSHFLNLPNIFPIETKRIPLLGSIACGEPIFAEQEWESYVECGTNIKADFALRAEGDSMIGARIQDGDIVFIRSQPMVDNGEIAAVIIDDSVTLKRVYYDREAQKLVLQAENPKYAPLVYIGSELEQIRILGKAIAFQSDVK